MIKNLQNTQKRITNIIHGNITQINTIYRGGPSIYFYHRILDLRQNHASVKSFLSSNTCIEFLYATLVAWDMDSRGAIMKDFDDFKGNLQSNIPAFQSVENAAKTFTWQNRKSVIQLLSKLYDLLSLMKSGGRLVSNSKTLHFVFPDLCLPMDRTNTLDKLYGNSTESKNKYIEVLEFAYDILNSIPNTNQYLDHQWNTCELKLVDNAIILM